jgi:hypothetical protein
MADVTVKVITPAINFDLLTLDEAKLMLGIATTDTSQDAQLALQISGWSVYAAEVCNRTFAREKVIETWREVGDGRVFLTHWPVKEADIESVVAPGGTPLIAGEYELEEASGKLSHIANPGGPVSTLWGAPAVIKYTGGYLLPDEAPLPLKQACAMLIREERSRHQQSSVAGLRMIAHKEKRVMFYDPNAAAAKQSSSGAAGSPAMQAINALLKQYTRFWV